MNECHPLHKKIVIHGHEWTVPNEPGWEEVLRVVEPIRHQLLSNCATSHECRLATEQLRKIFLQYPVSSKYYDDSKQTDKAKDYPNSIFKWG
ncbi:unnamed protein product [Rotaria magnacalcarata]|uniref:Uncharacterized protein n=1 Tax=Rotaria magnacalcarata TaxID=392030 RepID=A0A815KBU1_9BILA|nr:unnamed protein product [Rotaria magnacalcarata]CAF1393555.1 unnamed protein product [Rotaria magnacalcarata]CAF1922576.1 unnamed protein product [Rotaria magnacalcarata]CAF2122226.1 unnamed protein product [Rotaria magnacalcarata]CAF2156300.1 unnamed protein product [Rotaria magnacalcarata]